MVALLEVEEPTERLEAEICTLAGRIAAATCRFVLLAAELNRRRAWAEWGCQSMAHWLSWKCGVSIVTARQQVRVGHALEDLPLVRGAFASGQLSYSKVRALVRIAKFQPEAPLLNFAMLTTAAQLERTVAAYERTLPTEDEAADQLRKQQYAKFRNGDGTVTYMLRMPEEASARFDTALDAALDEVPRDDSAESPMHRRLGAVQVLAEHFLSGGSSQRVEVVNHIDPEIFRSPETRPVAERVTCDATLIYEPDGRRKRPVNRATRRRIRRRDRGTCRFPGCSNHRWLHVHHIVHYTRGGPSNVENCLLLCTFHHRLVHDGGWNIRGNAQGPVEFIDRRGRATREHTTKPTVVPKPLDEPAVDATTIATASGENLDLDLAVTAFMSRDGLGWEPKRGHSPAVIHPRVLHAEDIGGFVLEEGGVDDFAEEEGVIADVDGLADFAFDVGN